MRSKVSDFKIVIDGREYTKIELAQITVKAEAKKMSGQSFKKWVNNCSPTERIAAFVTYGLLFENFLVEELSNDLSKFYDRLQLDVRTLLTI